MNKYKSLISNTLVFALGTFGSKVLPLLLQSVTTRVLAPEQTSTANLISTTCNLILPVMYLCIADAVIRFGMDSSYRRGDVFSVGFFTVLAGFAVFCLFYPLMLRWPGLEGYTWLVYLYALASAMHTLMSQFVRASGMVTLFALDGVITTAFTFGFTLLFLLVFPLGIVGSVLGIVLADALSAVGLFVFLRLHRFLRIRSLDRLTAFDMYRYALPLIPTALGWWVTGLSDRYFVRAICGEAVNGVYVMAYFIPNLITQVSAIFTRAWELSAFTEYKSPEGERFFSNVFRSYYTFVFVLASGLILIARPVVGVWLGPDYREAWRYMPFLILATSFSCLVTFLGAIYNAAKQNMMVMITALISAVVNIVLNALMIPVWGAQGAAIATFISYLVVFVIRAVDTRKYIRIHMQPQRIVVNLVLLLLQCYVTLAEVKLWGLWSSLIFLALVLSNFGYILFLVRRLLAVLRSRRARAL